MGRKVEIPTLTDDAWTAGAYDILKILFYHIGESTKTYPQIADEAGLSPETLKQWKTGQTMPALDSILRCFGVLGFTLVVSRTEDSAFAHDGYFEMDYEFDRQSALKRGERPPPRRGSLEWIEANSIRDDESLDPTPEDIETDRRERSIPLAERIKARAPVEARKAEERRALIESKQRKKGKRRREASLKKPSPK